MMSSEKLSAIIEDENTADVDIDPYAAEVLRILRQIEKNTRKV